MASKVCRVGPRRAELARPAASGRLRGAVRTRERGRPGM